jgi:cyclophilin family peptidyl-prolyl cis-trans isomerase
MRTRAILLALCTAAIVAAQPPSELEAVVETELGTFRFAFAPNAPKHVEHFMKLVRQGYYDGSAFHRIVKWGIVQGGDPLLKNPKTPKSLWGTGGLNLLPGEYNALKHERGVVSTVRIPDKPNSDGAQFFICISPQPVLDGQFSSFGMVTEGMNVVEKISEQPAGAGGIAEKPIRIVRITLDKKKVEPFLSAPVEEMRKTVTLKTTLGTMKIKMEPDWAPENVRNFLKLVATGWYNGTSFHRIVKDFVVQGGMENTRMGDQFHLGDRWVHPVKAEFGPDAKHVRGVVSMAHGDSPDSATTSFFLMLAPSPHLDGKYSAFGRVVEGMDVLDAFEKEQLDGETPKKRLEIIEAVVDGNSAG